jgi:hypothetical protein
MSLTRINVVNRLSLIVLLWPTPRRLLALLASVGDTRGKEEPMSPRETATALGLAGVVALSTVTPTMASMPTAVAAIKSAPSNDTIDAAWGWWPGLGVGIGLGLLGAAIAAPYYYGYGYPYYGYPYGYGYYGGYGYPYGYYRYPYAYYGGYGPYAGYYAIPIHRSTTVRHHGYHASDR